MKISNLPTNPLSPDLFHKMDAWWRAADYVSVGRTYRYDNLLLKKPLKPEHVKPRLLGHWRTAPGLNIIADAFVPVDHEWQAGIYNPDSIVSMGRVFTEALE